MPGEESTGNDSEKKRSPSRISKGNGKVYGLGLGNSRFRIAELGMNILTTKVKVEAKVGTQAEAETE